MNRDAAVRLVNEWVDHYRLYLKDGGGAAGVHMVAKNALIEKIAEAFAQCRVPAPVPLLDEPPAAPKRPRGRPKREVVDG